MNLVATGRFLVVVSGFAMLWAGGHALRPGPVPPLVRAIVYCCGFWLITGGLLILAGVM